MTLEHSRPWLAVVMWEVSSIGSSTILEEKSYPHNEQAANATPVAHHTVS